jgi:hypothetical protein
MVHEGFAAGKALLGVLKAGDGRLGQLVLAHVGKRSRVDDVFVLPSSEQLEKIQPALRAGGCEERKAVITDMRAKAVPGLMPGARIVSGQP